MNSPRVLLVDDHAIIRRGLKYILASNFNIDKVGEAEDCKGMLELLEEKKYTHLILDLQLPDCNSINLFASIHEKYPDMAILVYTMSAEEVFARRVLQMGASGFLSKQSSEETVIVAIQLFLLGRKYVSPKMKESLLRESLSSDTRTNPFDELSEREMLVIKSLLGGKGVKEIASELGIKSTTVATYKARIFDKFGVSNLMGLRDVAEHFHYKA